MSTVTSKYHALTGVILPPWQTAQTLPVIFTSYKIIGLNLRLDIKLSNDKAC
ncbi:hypothetical protein ENHAE0001_0055 [Enhydrobacter aerosaccus SK60]|nr:hypothetical protein ENHAE0001_0055 [Enhydrobacter aerosaccus SK60]BAV11672.1 hypothetical protein MOSL_1099 [Moraxella osloensis]